MGLTTRKLQNSIVPQETPHYYEVKIPNHPNGVPQMHCGNIKDAKWLLEIYPDATMEKIYLPPSPNTVDVPHISVGKEQQLPMQQALPESDLNPLKL